MVPIPLTPIFHLRVFAPNNTAFREKLHKFLLYTRSWNNPNPSLPPLRSRFILTHEGENYDKVLKKTIRSHFHCYIQVYPSMVGKCHPSLIKTHTELRDLFKSRFPSHSGNKSYSLQKQKNTNLLSYILKEIDREKPLDPNQIEYSNFTPQEIKNVPLWLPKKTLFKNQLLDHMVSWYNIQILKPPHHTHYAIHGHYVDASLEILKWCREKHRYIPRSLYPQICLEIGVLTPYEFLSINNII